MKQICPNGKNYFLKEMVYVYLLVSLLFNMFNMFHNKSENKQTKINRSFKLGWDKDEGFPSGRKSMPKISKREHTSRVFATSSLWL